MARQRLAGEPESARIKVIGVVSSAACRCRHGTTITIRIGTARAVENGVAHHDTFHHALCKCGMNHHQRFAASANVVLSAQVFLDKNFLASANSGILASAWLANAKSFS